MLSDSPQNFDSQLFVFPVENENRTQVTSNDTQVEAFDYELNESAGDVAPDLKFRI